MFFLLARGKAPGRVGIFLLQNMQITLAACPLIANFAADTLKVTDDN
jgi:hypothetical protein